MFYPDGLPRRQELAYAAQSFGSLEVNASFYRLQSAATYDRWFSQTPADFVFALKGSRYITHMKKLRGAEAGLANFFASGLLRLRDKLGPFVWQLPPNLTFVPEVLEDFLAQLPTTHRAATELALLAERPGVPFEGGPNDRPLRHALEIRHPSFLSDDCLNLLRRHRVALVVADAAGLYPLIEEGTTDFMYVRLHGSQALYSSGYTRPELQDWERRIRAWSAGNAPADMRTVNGPPRLSGPQDVYVYFDNDIGAHAPADAATLRGLLGLGNPDAP
ncbi:DUF72 domain-containing protein [Deinococcus altitudinis]|uniref:DUF72 domain-containing protein n=1 Tax=Deinococcus altitudinis TaxID=468914 RepID=UPI00389188D4